MEKVGLGNLEYNECVGKFTAPGVCVQKETEESYNFLETEGEAMGVLP